MAQQTAFDAWSAMQKAMGGTGNYGDAPVYGTTGYIGGDPSSYAKLQSAEQAPSPGGNIGGYGTGAALSSMPSMVGNVAYDGDPYAQLKQAQAAQQAGGGSFMASTGNNQAPVGGFGSLTAGMTRDPGMMQPGQVSGGQYGSYASPSQSNPYTQQQAQSLTALSNQNLQQQVMPGIASGALANGSYGGSRQGIAEGLAAANSQTGLNNTLSQLYSGNYQNDVANSLQQQQLSNTYGLGMGQLALGGRTADQNYSLGLGQLGNAATANSNNFALGQGQLSLGGRTADQNFALGMGGLQNNATAQNQNFYTANRGQDLQQIGLGASLFGNGVNGQAGLGQGVYNTGQTAQQAPYNALGQYGNTLSQFSGLGGTQTQTGANSAAAGAIGGAVLGNKVGTSLGNLWGGLSASPYATTGTNYNNLGSDRQ